MRGVAAAAGDRVWPMPLTDEYKDEIKGEVADIRNSAGREGGAIKAAAFLWAVVEGDTEWAHLDIASVDLVRQGPRLRAARARRVPAGRARSSALAPKSLARRIEQMSEVLPTRASRGRAPCRAA